jgi:hypothetical protein
MASPEFGAPQYEQDEAAAQQAVDTKNGKVIDPNDPALMSESMDVDASQNAFAVPPPPPDGKWRAKLKQVEVRDASGQMAHHAVVQYDGMNDGKPYFVVNVEADLIDVSGKFDGVKMTQYHVKSAVDKRKNVDEMTTITHAAGGAVVRSGTAKARLDALEKALAGEPECVIESVWRASCQPCQDKGKKEGKRVNDFLVGMHRFPQTLPGQYDPFVKCPSCGTLCRAQAKPSGFFKVGEAKATRGVA